MILATLLSLFVTIAIILLDASPALAWGPVTHIALGIQSLATVSTPDGLLQAALANLPEVFLYGSLAPDIVQGRRLQSRLRRHSHNWSTGLGLLEAARAQKEKAFALGYLAHLAADVVAHNFFCRLDSSGILGAVWAATFMRKPASIACRNPTIAIYCSSCCG